MADLSKLVDQLSTLTVLEAAELAKLRGRPDQCAGRMDDLAVPDLDQANRAGRGPLRVGGLEVDGGEVEAHRARSRAR